MEEKKSFINRYFDKAFCINLDRRPDRWERVSEQFRKHSIEVERFPAVDGSKIGGNGTLNSSQLGCTHSHASLLRKIIENRWNRTLVMEDDVEFSEGINEFFEKNYNSIPKEWDMLYFGANHLENPTPKNNVISKITKSYTSHCYAITNKFAIKIIDNVTLFKNVIDVTYSNFHSSSESYSFFPGIAWQNPSYSDLEMRHVDYRGVIR